MKNNRENVSYTIKFVAGTGGTISPSGSKTYNRYDTVKVTATPNSTHEFSYFYKSDTQAYIYTNPHSFSATANTTITAYFKEKVIKYTISVGASGPGNAYGGGTFNKGAECTVSASPNQHAKFDGWYEGSTRVSTSTSYKFTVSEDRSLQARFSYIPSYSIEVGASGPGTAYGGGTYYSGDECTVSASPNTGAVFNGWYEGTTRVSTNKSYKFTVSKARSLVAKFSYNTFDVTVTASPGDGGTVSGGGTAIPYGTRTAVIAQANTDAHYHFNYWRRSDGETYNEARWDFTVTAQFECTAYFSLDTYNVYLGVDPQGSGTVEGAGTYTWGAVAHLVATPNRGYRFVRWTDGDTNADRYINVYSTTTLVAYFEPIIQHITFSFNIVNSGFVYKRGEAQDEPITELFLTADESVQVYVVDNIGYRFENWDGSTALNSRNRTFEWTGSYDRNYTVHEEYVGTIEVTLLYGDGGVDSATRVTQAQTKDRQLIIPYPYVPQKQLTTQEVYLTFTTRANTGFIFDHWERNGQVISEEQDFTMLVYGAQGNEYIYQPKFKLAEPGVYYKVNIDSNKYPTDGRFAYINFLTPGGISGNIQLTNRRSDVEFPEGTLVRVYHERYIVKQEQRLYFVAWSDAKPDNIYGYPGREWTSLNQNINLTIYYGDAVHLQCISSPEEGGYFVFRSGDRYESGYEFIGGKDQVITVQATAYPGYDFVEWQDTHSQIALRELTLSSDTTLTAIFRDNGGEKLYYNINTSVSPPNSGYILGGGRAQVGKIITLFAIAYDGYKFLNWNTGSKHYSLEFRVTNDANIVAYFEEKPPTPPITFTYDAILDKFLKKKRRRKISIIKY